MYQLNGTRGSSLRSLFFFFFNDTATTEIYTLSLHDALPISPASRWPRPRSWRRARPGGRDRKSTRLNSSHSQISYAVFCLKKKKKTVYQDFELTKRKQTLTHYKQRINT